MIESAELPRLLTYGGGAIARLPEVCKELGFQKIVVISGQSATKRITEKRVLPTLDDSPSLEYSHILADSTNTFFTDTETESIIKEIQRNDGVIAVGGGKIIDYCKVVCSLANHAPYISVPTSASHDGFSSPYVGFLLRKKVKRKKIDYVPQSPLAIVGDTWMISEAPYYMLSAGAADTIAKFIAIEDWKLANKVTNEPYNDYAATFSQLSAGIIENSSKKIAQGNEKAHRLVVKALLGSGVAMSIAESSRPASGSEHLVSHQLDLLSRDYSFEPKPHGAQCGVASIVMMYLHRGNWQKIRDLLADVKAPTTVADLGIEKEIFIEAVFHAQEIRPERYTILSSGIRREKIEEALSATGVA
ncbi:MAG: iron-containing alcohol dehydrogenase [Candidatus Hodarchaeota archaeon]